MTLAPGLRSAATRLTRRIARPAPADEFQSEKWQDLHAANAYFARDDDGSDDMCKMLEGRMGGRAISEINERHMAGTEALRGKAILEIGFGGGWYLAQALRQGAGSVHGFEAADNVIRSASNAFDRLGLGPYSFRKVDERYLGALPPGTIDVAFSITVFQHIHPRATAAYLRTAARVLSDGGYCLFQFLMNEERPVRDSNASGTEGLVSYTKAEVDAMVLKARLRTLVYAETWRDPANGNYWAWYKLAKAPSCPDPAPAAKNSDNVPHIAGLIPPGSRSILDVGCGMLHDGNPPSEDILHELCRGAEYEVTGIDAFPGCVKWREQNGPPGRYAVMDARDVRTLGRRFDVVLCHHVIEHLPKADGRRLLSSLEGMYDRLLVVATPTGFVDTEYNVKLHGNELERHLSGWDIAEFRERGYYIRQIKNQFIAFKTSDPPPAGASASGARDAELVRPALPVNTDAEPAPPKDGAAAGGRAPSLPRRAARRGLGAARAVRRHVFSDPRDCLAYLLTGDGQALGRAAATNDERRRMRAVADMIDEAILRSREMENAVRDACDRHHVPRYAILWYYLVRARKVKTVVETGVSYGTSTFMILLGMERNGAGTLYSIDDGARIGLPDGAGVGYFVDRPLRRRWHLSTGDSAALLGPLLARLGEIDMFVHDSQHTEDVMSFEYNAAWAHIRPGGILASDDVNLTESWGRFTAANSGQIDALFAMQEMARPSDSEYPRPTVAFCTKRAGGGGSRAAGGPCASTSTTLPSGGRPSG